MFISTFGYENVWFHPRMIPHSKPAESTSCSKITDTTSIAIDLSQALRGNCRVPFLVFSKCYVYIKDYVFFPTYLSHICSRVLFFKIGQGRRDLSITSIRLFLGIGNRVTDLAIRA